MNFLFRMTVITWIFVCSFPIQTCVAQVESRQDKLNRLESELTAKTGGEKLGTYRKLLHLQFYVPDKIRAKHIQQMLAKYEPKGDSKGIAVALVAQAYLQIKQGRYDQCQKTCEKAAPYALECADLIPETHFKLLCLKARLYDDPKKRMRIAKEAVSFAAPWGDRLPLNYAYRSLGLVSRALGNNYDGDAYFTKEYEFSKRVKDRHAEATATLVKAARNIQSKNFEEAELWLSRTEKISKEIGAPRLILIARLRRILLDGGVSGDNPQKLKSLMKLLSLDLGPLSFHDRLIIWKAVSAANCELYRFDAADEASIKQMELAATFPKYEMITKLDAIQCTLLRARFEKENKSKLLDLVIEQLNDFESEAKNFPKTNAKRLSLLASAYKENKQYQQAYDTLNTETKYFKRLSRENNDFQTKLSREVFDAYEREQNQLAAEAEYKLQLSEANATNRIRNLIGTSIFLLLVAAIFGVCQHYRRLSLQQDLHAKQLSTELAQRTEELSFESEKTRKLAVENERKRRHETVGQIAGGIAHDFNNLLSVIIQSNEMLACSLKEDRDKVMIQRSNQAADTATDIVRQLMAYVSKTPLTNSLVDVNSWLNDVSGLFKSALPSHIKFNIRNSTNGLSIYSDSAQLTTAVINIITNAMDAVHGKTEPTITLEIDHKTQCNNDLPSTATPAGCLVIKTTDNGIGMTKEQIEFSCEPFVTSKNMAIGTGLGLSMVSGFARQSGGRLQIQSIKGKETSVAIIFPVATSAPDISDSTADSSQISQLKSVLLVDDNKFVREAISLTLSAFGYQVHTSVDGDEAIKFLQTNPIPDLVLSDIQMPGMHDGIKLRKWILENELQTVVILMSGFHQSQLDDDALFLPKPFRMNALKNLIGKLIPSRQ